MRTTVTLEKDVEKLLREEMHRTRTSFKETLNRMIRASFSLAKPPGKKKPFIVKAQALGVRPGIDPTGFNKLMDDLEIDSYIEKSQRSRR